MENNKVRKGRGGSTGGGNRFVSLCGGRSEHLRRPGHLRVGGGETAPSSCKGPGVRTARKSVELESESGGR